MKAWTSRVVQKRLLAALAGVAAMTVPLPSPARALPVPSVTKDVPIQPGAPMIDPWSGMEGSFCTLNFVFKDRAKKNAKTYIGTAKSCTEHVGERARSPQVGDFGTVVYMGQSANRGGRLPLELSEVVGDFALIQIDRDKLKYVSRVVRGFGTAPTGYTTSRTTNPGDPLVSHGYPYGAQDGAEAVTRVGVLGDDTSTDYWSSIQPNIQDKGSPVIRADGKAIGMSDELSSFWATWLPEAPPISRYPTIEGLLKQLKRAGFNVSL